MLSSFGKYVRFYVKKDDEPSSVSSSPVQLPNVFTILMAHRSPSQTLPPRIAPARNKKDELHNAILDWLEKQAMERVLDGLSFSCGSELQDADIPPDLKDVVYVKKLQCTEPVEKLYYSANLQDICIHCSEEMPESEESQEYYPQCSNCSKPRIPRKN